MAVRLPPKDTTAYRKLKLSAAMKQVAAGIEDRHRETAAAYLLLMSEEVAWETGMVYHGHSLSKREDGWLLVVRSVGRDGPVVAFSGGTRQADAILGFAHALTHGYVNWRPDKFRQ